MSLKPFSQPHISSLIAQDAVQYCYDIFSILYGIQNTGLRRRNIVQYLMIAGMLYTTDDFKSFESINLVECCASSSLMASKKYCASRLSRTPRGNPAYAKLISPFTSSANT
ncbi:hypothetical protein AVEN_266524-1 [Araneus ventricosus]|uniref:Uncharacterized protein n=1 Tax=Araneus ventricosus TaxID=182803 RepID=A0A4Y2MWG0_ARAVE|nr:hypothetical protein AVEN_266524-1 [Araneus ventricosus]